MARRRSTPAARTVAEILRAQYRPLDYAQGRAVAEQRAEQARLGATTKAVVAALQAGVKPVQATYDNALQQQQALAQNAAGLLSSANPNAATQADLASIGAPAEQRAQLAGQAQAQFPGQAGVLYTQQGSIPGASLLATRQADIAHLAGMPTLAALQSGESLRGLLATAARQRDKYVADRLGIAAQGPQLQLGLQQRAEDLRQKELDRQFQAEQARLGRMLTPYEKAQIANMNKPPSALDIYEAETARINARTSRRNAVAGSKPGGAGGGRTATPNQIRQFAETAYYGVKPRQQSVLQPDGSRKVVNVGGTPAIGYQKALFRLMHTYNLKLADAQAVLNDYYAPGEDGRPYYSYQRRKKLGVTDTGKPLKKKRK